MKRILITLLGMMLLAPMAQATTWSKSPALEKLIVELKQVYASKDLSEYQKEKMTYVDNLSFFIRFHDKPDAPEYPLLKAYLWGTQRAYINSVNLQMETNIIPWFCPKGLLKGISPNAKNPTLFIENIIWQGLEQDIKEDPNRFIDTEWHAAFGPLTGLTALGLQTAYPCYENPHAVSRVY